MDDKRYGKKKIVRFPGSHTRSPQHLEQSGDKIRDRQIPNDWGLQLRRRLNCDMGLKAAFEWDSMTDEERKGLFRHLFYDLDE